LIEENGVVVGMLGFKGAPVAHRVDVGYGISPSARGRGVATAALSLLLGQIQNRKLTVRAETALENVASQAVVQRCNFDDVGRAHTFEDGELIVWERFVD
jgi:RimJ/RimL family protein N-acetyltransferase